MELHFIVVQAMLSICHVQHLMSSVGIQNTSVVIMGNGLERQSVVCYMSLIMDCNYG